MLDSCCLRLGTCIFCNIFGAISSTAHHNPHINAIFVYVFMQELFIDKIHSFKFLSISDKPRLHQLKIITSPRSTVQTSLTAWMFHPYGEIPSRKGKYPMLRKNTKPHQLIKHAKVFCSIASLLFRKFSYHTYRNGLNRSISRLTGLPQKLNWKIQHFWLKICVFSSIIWLNIY